jgi:Protein of unknown function (DUF3300)
MKTYLTLAAALVAVLFTANLRAQAPAAPGGAATAPSAAELDVLVGRIALYPDDLVAIILPAATNPLQVVQADRYLEKRKTDPKAPLTDGWDDAVKSLLNYPEVVKMMSGDLDWTSDLGEAVVADQGAVLEAIQVFRRKTQSVGNLKTDAKQTVVVEKEVIKIVPANPQVIYVPQYNPATVVVAGGYSAWAYYPSPYPVYYYPYPPGAALATGLVWGAAIGAAWNGGRYGANYGGGNNNINIDRSTNVNVNRSGSASQQPAKSGQWQSNKQPGQVSSSTGRTQGARVGDTSRSGSAGGARPSTQPSGGNFGGGDRGGGAGAGGGAFGGANASGRQTQLDSSRGASSRGNYSAGGANARSMPTSSMRGGGGGMSGGGGRAGGGGGRRR